MLKLGFIGRLLCWQSLLMSKMFPLPPPGKEPTRWESICATYRHSWENLRDVPDFPKLVRISNFTRILQYADPIARRYAHSVSHCEMIEHGNKLILADSARRREFLSNSNEGTYANLVYYATHCNSDAILAVVRHLIRHVRNGGVYRFASSAKRLRESGSLLVDNLLYDLLCPMTVTAAVYCP